MRLGQVIQFFILLFFSGTALAQSPELLSRITGSELASVRSANDWFIKRHLYTARSHSIVSVDTRALLAGGDLTIRFSDADSYIVKTESVQILGLGAGIIWTGTIVDPSRSVSDMVLESGNQQQARIAHESTYGLTITGSRAEVETETGINIPIFLDDEQKAMRPEFRGSGDSSKWFYQYRMVFRSPDTGRTYSLSSLEMGGPYHIVKELNSEKIIRPGRVEDSPDPNEAKKRREWQDFLDSIGDDPRTALRANQSGGSQQ